VLLRGIRGTRRSRGFTSQLGKALNLRGLRTTHEAEPNIIAALRGTGRGIIIDEAHQLTPDALELLRDIHDKAGVPIVLPGTVKLQDQVNDQGFYFAQLSSRIAIKYDMTDDVELLLTKLSHIPGWGGLRLCSKVVQVAASLSQGELIDAELLLRVIRTLHGGQSANSVERQLEQSPLKVSAG
jgi:hypothetical protein